MADNNSFKKQLKADTEEVETTETITTITTLDEQLYSKDEEIKQLKLRLAEAQKINSSKVGDIRASVNDMGDVKLICIGLDEFGHRIWKKATDLSDADIKRREDYINSIKAENAKKY